MYILERSIGPTCCTCRPIVMCSIAQVLVPLLPHLLPRCEIEERAAGQYCPHLLDALKVGDLGYKPLQHGEAIRVCARLTGDYL
jgi:hypothetical protein